MVGADNRYGHPHEEVLTRLAEAGVKIYRTDLHGDIVVTSNGQKYAISVKQLYQHQPPDEPGKRVLP